MNEKCIDCHYWSMVLEADERNDDDGKCHRYPPIRVGDGSDPCEPAFNFTETQGNFWCGEFLARNM